MTPEITPVNNWGTVAAQAIRNGWTSVGQFLASLSLAGIALSPKDIREICRVFQEYAEEHQALLYVVRSLN